jgi:hypothetical protein
MTRFHNIIFKIKHKLNIPHGTDPPPPEVKILDAHLKETPQPKGRHPKLVQKHIKYRPTLTFTLDTLAIAFRTLNNQADCGFGISCGKKSRCYSQFSCSP